MLKEQITTSYYEVEGIGKRKTTEEIQSDKERRLQTSCDLRARGTEKLKDDRSGGINVNLMHSDTLMFNFFEKFLRMKLIKEKLCEKSNRIQIADLRKQ